MTLCFADHGWDYGAINDNGGKAVEPGGGSNGEDKPKGGR